MPLTARHHDLGVLDTTEVADETWSAIHRSSPRAPLTCRSCGASMQAKVSSTGLRFFAHDRREATCPSAGESPAHRHLKKTLAKLARKAGAHTVVEAEPSPDDRGGWRADVLVIAPDGRRIAFEAQLAAMTTAVGLDRTGRYSADDIETVWFTTKHAPWLFSLPGVKVDEVEGTLLATRGCAQIKDKTWSTRSDVPLHRLVDGLIVGRVRAYGLDYLIEPLRQRDREVTRYHSSPVALCPAKHISDHQSELAAMERARAAERRRQEQHRLNMLALQERQQRLLPIVAALLDLESNQQIWAGVPPTPMNNGDQVSLANAAGNERTAYGAVLWTGPARDQLTLRAVICPVASRVSRKLGGSWRARHVTVHVETANEAERVAQALGWRTADLQQHPPAASSAG